MPDVYCFRFSMHTPFYDDKLELENSNLNSFYFVCREVLEDLETMWQAASKDNERMQDTIRRTNRKLQEHVGLRSCLEDELEPNDKLDFVLKQCVCDESQN